jgi:hypothetical protein
MRDTGGSASELSQLKQRLLELEQKLLQPDIRRDPKALDSLLADEFREFGSSGRIFDKRSVIEALHQESHSAFSIRDFSVVLVADGVALATYVAVSANTSSLRSSLWVMRDDQWRMLFHQGTRVPE